MVDMHLRGLTATQAKNIAALLERLKKDDPVALDNDDPPDPDGPGGPK